MMRLPPLLKGGGRRLDGEVSEVITKCPTRSLLRPTGSPSNPSPEPEVASSNDGALQQHERQEEHMGQSPKQAQNRSDHERRSPEATGDEEHKHKQQLVKQHRDGQDHVRRYAGFVK